MPAVETERVDPDGPENEVRFADGNVSAVVKVGDTVRREAGPWTPAVHALLRHLEASGFDGAPRPLGFDARGREIVSYINGVTAPASLLGYASDETLVAVAHLIRRYHDAVAQFRPPAEADWRFAIGAPRAGEVVCHNDLAPWNTVFRNGKPVAFIDWDFAAPGPRTWDLAYALWRFVPLYPDAAYGPPAERARRIVRFCDAYGFPDRSDLIEVIERRQRVLYDTLAFWGEAGVPGFVEMWRSGHGDGIRRDLAYLREHRAFLERVVTENASARRMQIKT